MNETYSARATKGIAGFLTWVESTFRGVPARGGRLTRPRHPRVIAGVCSGMAQYFGWDVRLLRILMVVAALSSFGLVVPGYALAWVLVPEGAYALPGEAGKTSGTPVS